MSTILRIVLILLSVAALYYLVVTLARSMSEQETGALGAGSVELAARSGPLEGRVLGAHG